MFRYFIVILIVLSLSLPGFGDTFVNRTTGQVFYGFATGQKRANKTLVRSADNNKSQYLNLAEYTIEWNYHGRKRTVFVLPIKDAIEFECETQAFEKAITAAANQGPCFVVIEIDTPGGREDLMKRICSAITTATHCRTLAFVSGGDFGGAYSAGAIIALACNDIYMADSTAIGAATTVVHSSSGVQDLKTAFGETVGEKYLSADRAYVAAVAEQNGRPAALARAMVDKDVEVVEVIDDGRSVFIESRDRKSNQTIKKSWSKRGSLLTLTAYQAVKAGICNDVASSTKQLLADLNLSDARIIRNSNIIKARRQLEAAQRKQEKLLSTIDLYHKEIERLDGHANFLTKEYNRLNNRFDIRNRRSLMKGAIEQRNKTFSSLSRLYKKLISQYKAVISLNKEQPDLQIDIAQVKEAINSVNIELRAIQAKFKRSKDF